MKNLLFGFAVCLTACHPGSGQKTASLVGTYVKVSESEYSKAHDTLEVTSYAGGGNIYVLSERNGYTVLREGQPTTSGHKQYRETAVFNPSTGQLQGLASGRLLVFSPEKGALLAGAGVYQKINEK
jgi:hypothetical protein